MKLAWIDTLRCLAALAVVAVHTTSPIFSNYQGLNDSNWWTANVINTVSRFCVPMFVMISGYLLLGREQSINIFYKKKVLRIVPPLIFWSVAYVIFFQLMDGHFNFFKAIKDTVYKLIYYGKTSGHLWYLTMILCLFSFAPFINKFLLGEKLNTKDVACLFLVFMLFSVGLEVSLIMSKVGSANISWYKEFPKYLCYFILGYYVGNGVILNSVNVFLKSLIVIFILVLGVFGNFLLAHWKDITVDYLVLSNNGVLNFLVTVLIFSIVKDLKGKVDSSRILGGFALLTFGIYLIHPMVISLLKPYFFPFYSPVTIVFYIVAVFTISAFFIYLLRKIYLFRYLC